MRIEKLSMKNIGVFDDITLEFPAEKPEGKAEIHLLTGPNGTGKSTVLYALASAFYVEPIRNRVRSVKDSRIGISYEFGGESLEDEVYCREGDGYLLQWKNHQATEILKYAYLERNKTQVENSKFNSALFSYSGSRKIETASLTNIREPESTPFSGALSFNAASSSNEIVQWVALNKAKASIAKDEGKMEDAERFKTAIEKLEEIIARIIGRNLSFVFNYNPFNVKINYQNKELEFDVLPDGLKSIISWIADLLMRLDRIPWAEDCSILERNFVLFLDEIEIHLHPSWQWKILPVVQELFPNAQIFIATHSPFVVASVGGAWIHRLQFSNGTVKAAEPKYSQQGESYQSILESVFEVDDVFDPETETELDEFYALRTEVLKNGSSHDSEFIALAAKLKERSLELNNIISRELAQARRITERKLPL